MGRRWLTINLLFNYWYVLHEIVYIQIIINLNFQIGNVGIKEVYRSSWNPQAIPIESSRTWYLPEKAQGQGFGGTWWVCQ